MSGIEAKDSLERDEIKENLTDLEQELKVNKEIHETFDEFNTNLALVGSEYNPELIDERNLSMERMRNGNVMVKSYGQTCEVNLKTWKISYHKWNLTISLDEIAGEKILFDNNRLRKEQLYHVFWKMNMINRIVSISKQLWKKNFYFEDWNLFQIAAGSLAGHNNECFLKLDWKKIVSIWWLKRWFQDDVKLSDINKELENGNSYSRSVDVAEENFKKRFVNMLHKIVW